MPDGQGYTVKPEELRTHGGTLNGVADRVKGAGGKGGAMQFGIETFGIVGQLFAGDANRVSHESARQIADFAEDIRDLAAVVRGAGDLYHGTERAHESPFKVVREA
ncbi:type VII secretion target [Amycolatopsis anabasis]|uniref:type VII secretion target n=1 Tax=Amycolatopsis anabasis TaxID=1840409 RepID=UPI00131A8409|nr:type VII secretion target [Amycolatopsis anabasis]